MKVRAIIGGIINYILAIACAVVFELFLNANVGRFVLLALLLAPALSVFFAWLSGRMVSVSCEMEDVLLSKGDTCSMTVTLRNHSIFPTSPIEVKMADTPRVVCEDTDIIASVLPKAEKSFAVTFRAKICGKSMIGVKEVRVTDYLGLFSFPIKRTDDGSRKKKAAVIPGIAEISARDDNIMQAMQASRNLDDSEDMVESQAVTFGGFPGYDSREYVPGDPLKRINWKQSAKRDKLIVRLDDEVSSQTIHVVLDSVYEEESIHPEIAEDAVENALGIIRVLVRHDYTVNYYAMGEHGFTDYQIEDELDLENVRLAMAEYSFAGKEAWDKGIERFPGSDILGKGGEGAFLFSTPNSLDEAEALTEGQSDNIHVTVYSAAPSASEAETLDVESVPKKAVVITKEKTGLWKKFLDVIKEFAPSYFLAFLLSLSVFLVFDVPIISVWTLLQAVVCACLFAVCTYVNRHRIIGSMLMTVLMMALLSVYARIVFSSGYGITYTHWFLSGGESVDSTAAYLLSLVVMFTVFFSVVVYYFANVLYRTSFLMLVSLIPFLIHVKIMKDINMVPVVFITVLNVVILLMYMRKNRDSGKRMVGYVAGFVSVAFYALVFVLIGLAAPKQENTRYYYAFENAFMGGNISEQLPESYSQMSSFSGNADNFNELNNRKLYEVNVTKDVGNLYLKRQNFDLYDFENDRWYALEEYAQPDITPEVWGSIRNRMDLGLLAKAMECVEGYEPGFLEKYGLNRIESGFEEPRYQMEIETMNFPSVAYLTTARTAEVAVPQDRYDNFSDSRVSSGGVYQNTEGFLDRNLTYMVDFYHDFNARNRWIQQGGANMNIDTAMTMLEEMEDILSAEGETEYGSVVDAYMYETQLAMEYREACAENNELIPDSIRELAAEITGNCTYDWEKALAIQNYFQQNDFVYDLSYRAPDDSVEYFLFEGKTGTCSDFASAYVLLARAAGVTARYAEGFVPAQEYEDLYVVRTNCGHAYPEVYIENVGFVVYEATMPASYRNSVSRNSGVMFYLMRAGVRGLIILAAVSGIIMTLLFLKTVFEPFVRELWFHRKFGKAEPGKAVVMLYKRIAGRHMGKLIRNAGAYTPYEYAVIFEDKVGYDMSGITFMLEDAAYCGKTLNGEDKRKAREIYKAAVAALRQKKKEWAKERRRRHGKQADT
ncbi:MAG: DUF58 domain-containing protein [Lachnoclostridium sp.]|nr:DUF58 domain-containing protein [Lachnospira sp.]MCM1247830.1 DUF58 domain-containing protein [Lachnoclostridium sp.]MCM1535836.1 DUF58 domain-containing protein [Clostridium sp.]